MIQSDTDFDAFISSFLLTDLPLKIFQKDFQNIHKILP